MLARTKKALQVIVADYSSCDISKNSVLLISLCMAIILHTLIVFSIWEYTTDDAFITYRYSRHLAEGYGPVFNTEGARVEGYTSPLWMLLLAITYRISSNLEFNSKVLGLVLNITTLVLLALVLNRFKNSDQLGPKYRSPLGSSIGLIWVSINTPFVVSSVEGLETPLLSLFIVLALWLLLVPQMGIWTIMGLAAAQAGMYFTRPDSALMILAIMVMWLSGLFPNASATTVKERLKSIAICYTVVGGLVVGHLLWRHSYYGYWFPATFYAKAGGSIGHFISGVQRIVSFYRETWLAYLLILQPIVLGLIWANSKTWLKLYAIVVMLISSRILFVLYSGGEIMGFHRFLVPVIPLIGILWMWTLGSIDETLIKSPSQRWLVMAGIAAIVLITAIYQLRPGLGQVRGYRQWLKQNHEQMGYWLKANADLADGIWTVAAGDVGVMFYIADNVRALDLMGLNDYHIAQLPGKWIPRTKSPKSDPAYVLGQMPEIIVFRGNPATQPLDQFQTIEKDIIQSDIFQKSYTFVHASGWLHAYARQDLVTKLRQAGNN